MQRKLGLIQVNGASRIISCLGLLLEAVLLIWLHDTLFFPGGGGSSGRVMCVALWWFVLRSIAA